MNAAWITSEEFASLKPVDLNGKEHGAKNKPCAGHRNRHIWFRKRVSLDDIATCTVRITADDVYKLYINGAFVMSGPAPSYPRAHYYNEKKIDRFLHTGENEILVHTYYQGLCNRHLYSGDLRHGLWFEFTCGGDTVCVSDTD